MGDPMTVWAETVLGSGGSFVPAVPGRTNGRFHRFHSG